MRSKLGKIAFFLGFLSFLVLVGKDSFSNKVFAQSARIVQIDVRIVDGNPNGTISAPRSLGWTQHPYNWDVLLPFFAEDIAPDIAIYIPETGRSYRCYNLATGFQLNDSLACAFVGVQVPSGGFSIEIIDIDLSEHDEIGRGACQIGDTCRIGQAEVTVSEIPCNDPEIQVSYQTSPEFQWSYDTSVSGYHFYPFEGRRIESKICSTNSPGCTRESVFQTMLSQVRFIAPTEAVEPVVNCGITVLDIPLYPSGDDPIRTTINYSEYSITNYTRYDHAFHPGYVTRTIVERNGDIYVSTVGEGYGAFPTENSIGSYFLWPDFVDPGLVEAVQNQL